MGQLRANHSTVPTTVYDDFEVNISGVVKIMLQTFQHKTSIRGECTLSVLFANDSGETHLNHLSSAVRNPSQLSQLG